MYLLVSGSPHPTSANSRLLQGIGRLHPDEATLADYLPQLPLFQPDREAVDIVNRWRKDVAQANAIIFCTPAYLYNLPAVLKNALEWLTTGGEVLAKPVLVFTFTPHPPRGDKARQSLLWSLQALNARIVAEAPLYQNEVRFLENGDIAPGPERDLLLASLELLP
ncbi:MAG: NAD(P)H-dependent oxidoreductase [Bacteroidota bacterium]